MPKNTPRLQKRPGRNNGVRYFVVAFRTSEYGEKLEVVPFDATPGGGEHEVRMLDDGTGVIIPPGEQGDACWHPDHMIGRDVKLALALAAQVAR